MNKNQINPELDIVIPVYNEKENILDLFQALETNVKIPFRVFICHDFDEDSTLETLKVNKFNFRIIPTKNRGKGVHDAIMTGLEATTAPAVLVLGADEANNARIIDKMHAELKKGSDVIVASRLIKGGEMSGGPRFKSFIVTTASFILRWFAFLPATDATYAWRMFSRRILDAVEIESTQGFTYSIELLVKCHRLGWKTAEVPARWIIRKKGESRFNLKKWLPHYAKWFLYAFGTTYLKKGPKTVKLKPGAKI